MVIRNKDMEDSCISALTNPIFSWVSDPSSFPAWIKGCSADGDCNPDGSGLWHSHYECLPEIRVPMGLSAARDANLTQLDRISGNLLEYFETWQSVANGSKSCGPGLETEFEYTTFKVCTCSPEFGRTGPNCAESNIFGWILTCLILVVCILCVAVSLVLVADVFTQYTANSIERWKLVQRLSSLLSLIATFFVNIIYLDLIFNGQVLLDRFVGIVVGGMFWQSGYILTLLVMSLRMIQLLPQDTATNGLKRLSRRISRVLKGAKVMYNVVLIALVVCIPITAGIMGIWGPYGAGSRLSKLTLVYLSFILTLLVLGPLALRQSIQVSTLHSKAATMEESQREASSACCASFELSMRQAVDKVVRGSVRVVIFVVLGLLSSGLMIPTSGTIRKYFFFWVDLYFFFTVCTIVMANHSLFESLLRKMGKSCRGSRVSQQTIQPSKGSRLRSESMLKSGGDTSVAGTLTEGL